MVVNKAEALSRLENDTELYDEIVAVFLEDTPVQIENLQAALEAGDDATSLRLAHSLKSASGNVGANSLREVAFAMESAARKGGAAGAAPLFKSLRDAYKAVEDFFRRGGGEG